MREAAPMPLPAVDPNEVRARPKKRSMNPPTSGSSEAKDVASRLARYSGNPSSMPLKWVGELFFNKPGKGRFRCTAQFVSSNVILTAAHCVRDEESGQFYKDFRFALQYNEGKFSHLYGYKCVASKNGWVRHDASHWDWDYAMLLADQPSRDGWFGTQWNWRGRYDRATKIGYPGGILNGEVIQVDSGPLTFTDDDEEIARLVHGKPQKQGGTSGGAWVGDYSTSDNQKNHVISVSSHTRGNDETVIYGPYLDDSFKDLFNYTARGCR
jgi:hypothetical protein